jgi:uncharacterized membrane protein
MVSAALWNLFLAVLPIPLGALLARRIAAADPRRRWPRPPTLALFGAWLLLLPNAPYLLTDLRHFLFDERWRELTHAARHDAGALRATALWGLGFLAYAAAGLVALTLAVRPVQEAVRLHRPALRRLRVPFFLLVALGVWLGLIPRFNSWDALMRPTEVIGAALWVLTQPATLAMIVAFGALLAALHDLACAAWDGWRLRHAALPPTGDPLAGASREPRS